MATFDKDIKEIRGRFELDVLDAFDEFFNRPPFSPRDQHLLGSRDGGISDFHHAVFRDGREKTDFDRMAHVDVIGKGAGQEQPTGSGPADTPKERMVMTWPQ